MCQTRGVTLCVLLLVSLSASLPLSPQRSAHKEFEPAYRRIDSAHKRTLMNGNPCPDAEKPFPCKTTPTCIPMGYLCDDNVDCEDGYDEDREVCTAAHRPPVQDILTFLESERGWIMDSLFGGKDIRQVAHGLAVSPTVSEFTTRLDLEEGGGAPLRAALKAVKGGDEEALARLGMPPSAWTEVSFVFSKLIKSGFLD